jgi:Family of unknown function (DUF5681)
MTPDTPATNAARKQRGRPFQKGKSGNPAGTKTGSRHRVTLLAEALLQGEAEALTRKAIELALAGDVACLRLCIDRIAPAPRNRAVAIDLAEVGHHDGGNALLESYAAIVRGVGRGELSPSEALELADLLDRQRSAVADLKPGRLEPEPTHEQLAAEKLRADQLRASFDRIELGRF